MSAQSIFKQLTDLAGEDMAAMGLRPVLVLTDSFQDDHEIQFHRENGDVTNVVLTIPPTDDVKLQNCAVFREIYMSAEIPLASFSSGRCYEIKNFLMTPDDAANMKTLLNQLSMSAQRLPPRWYAHMVENRLVVTAVSAFGEIAEPFGSEAEIMVENLIGNVIVAELSVSGEPLMKVEAVAKAATLWTGAPGAPTYESSAIFSNSRALREAIFAADMPATPSAPGL